MSEASRLSAIAVDAGLGSDARLAEPSGLAALRGQLAIIAAVLDGTNRLPHVPRFSIGSRANCRDYLPQFATI
jgi:hypothetical protein